MVEEKVVTQRFNKETLKPSYLIDSTIMWSGIEDYTIKGQGDKTRI
jgi:hypothetical protein